MQNRNGYLYFNDTILLVPQPTYEQGYNSFVESLRQFYPSIVRYVEPGKLFSTANVILTSETKQKTNQLPSGVYIPKLSKMGILKNYGFRNPETNETYSDHVLDAFKHVLFAGLTVRNHRYSLTLLKELIDSRPEVAFALSTIYPKPEGEREVRIRTFGTDEQLDNLLVELEKIPLAVRSVDVKKPTLGKEGLGNKDDLYLLSV